MSESSWYNWTAPSSLHIILFSPALACIKISPSVFVMNRLLLLLAIYEFTGLWYISRLLFVPKYNLSLSAKYAWEAKVVTPAILTLSKFVWPSTSKSWGMLTPTELVSKRLILLWYNSTAPSGINFAISSDVLFDIVNGTTPSNLKRA